MDCVFVSNVFHHILYRDHQIYVDALYKVLKADGQVFIFEHNPYNPVTRFIFKHNDCDSPKGEIGRGMLKPRYCTNLLKNAGFSDIQTDYTLFFLKRSPFFMKLEGLLKWLPLGAQYCAYAKRSREIYK
jgi:SAM-dependent methyltransferase